MFVALSRFIIHNDMAAQVRQAFAARPHLVDAATGFLGMQVMSPVENPAEFWLVTRWIDEQSYRSWHRSHSYHESHQSIPKGLKLVPKSADIRLFDWVAE
jgi:heme-degrading monooxygenase HmoA